MTRFFLMIALLFPLVGHAAGDDARKTPMFPELWRARAVAMNADTMLFQGFERVGNQSDPEAATIKQEWAVQVMAEPPEELAETSHRPGHRAGG